MKIVRTVSILAVAAGIGYIAISPERRSLVVSKLTDARDYVTKLLGRQGHPTKIDDAQAVERWADDGGPVVDTTGAHRPLA